ncbi:hypothetical protein CAEBREN_09189 [Caenorhabditis brenneri]|uniref:Uncharacterized protein n=1 Tax=Caenorhabditis brenneri TaxID=135651 RepID=G0NNG4_CAEBE|nr:hypothetical protein CAEBREN_09189 [Caenorhabditis brenneri]
MEVSIPSNIEQELLAEIQLYRDKQKLLEESKLARMIKEIAIYFIFYLSFAWCLILFVGSFLPSILPSIHPELSAINAGFLLAGVLLGLYGIVMMWSEKKSITQLEHYESRAADDKKALGLLDQLKQNQEMYQQKVDEELRKSFLLLSRMLVAVYSYMPFPVMAYTLVGDSFVKALLYAVFLFSAFAAQIYCSNMAFSDRKP